MVVETSDELELLLLDLLLDDLLVELLFPPLLLVVDFLFVEDELDVPVLEELVSVEELDDVSVVYCASNIMFSVIGSNTSLGV